MRTVTTVGYGDVAAITTAGCLIGMGIILLGLRVRRRGHGAIAQYVVARSAAESQAASTNQILGAVDHVRSDLGDLSERLERIENHVDDPNAHGGTGSSTARPPTVSSEHAD